MGKIGKITLSSILILALIFSGLVTFLSVRPADASMDSCHMFTIGPDGSTNNGPAPLKILIPTMTSTGDSGESVDFYLRSDELDWKFNEDAIRNEHPWGERSLQKAEVLSTSWTFWTPGEHWIQLRCEDSSGHVMESIRHYVFVTGGTTIPSGGGGGGGNPDNFIPTLIATFSVIAALGVTAGAVGKIVKSKKSSRDKIKEKAPYDSYKGVMPIDFDTTKLSGNTPKLLREQEPPGGRPIPTGGAILTTVNPVTGQHGISDNQIRSNAYKPNVGKFGLVRTVVDPKTKHLMPQQHDGIDILAPRGTDIHPARSGKIIFAGIKEGYGNTIDIDHGNGLVTRYAHLDKMNIHTGHVNTTDIIGQAGTTGNAKTMPVAEEHLHFEVRLDDKPKNPIDFLNDLPDPKEWKGF